METWTSLAPPQLSRDETYKVPHFGLGYKIIKDINISLITFTRHLSTFVTLLFHTRTLSAFVVFYKNALCKFTVS